MPIFDIGRVCIKKAGREAGKQCVVVDVVDKNFVLITGPKDVSGVKRRRVNVDHLEPTELKIEIKKGAGDEEVKKALSKIEATKVYEKKEVKKEEKETEPLKEVKVEKEEEKVEKKPKRKRAKPKAEEKKEEPTEVPKT
jgi:large subunit ribosomal protein L14e